MWFSFIFTQRCDFRAIILDYCQSHIFYHLVFIFNGSMRHEVRLTFHITAQDKISLSCFLFSTTRRQTRMFTQDLKLNIIWRTLWDSWQVETYCFSSKCCCQRTVTVYSIRIGCIPHICCILSVLHVDLQGCKIQAAHCWSQLLHYTLY